MVYRVYILYIYIYIYTAARGDSDQYNTNAQPGLSEDRSKNGGCAATIYGSAKRATVFTKSSRRASMYIYMGEVPTLRPAFRAPRGYREHADPP